jgi:pilus assembly protein Flp/PilA
VNRTLGFARGSVGGDSGATATEYALIAVLIAVVIVTAVVLLGTNVFGLYDSAASSVPG